jgi:RNA polymerase sigma-70 factor (ECF subfamily)
MIRPSDGQLLRAFRNGDAAAFAELVEAHQGTLLRHARALLGPGSTYEDAVQEVFLKLAQSPPEIPEEAAGDPRLERMHLLSWLHRVTRNCCMDTMRSEKRRRRRESDVAEPEAEEGGIAAVEAGDTRAAVEREIGRLPVEQREVLVLRLLSERSYKEIAEITGKPIGTVGWLVSVGLKALSEALAPMLGGGLGAGLAAEPVRATRNEGGATSARLDVVRGELS